MKEQPIKHPASGGSWKRNADGSLKQIERSTEHHPGKSAGHKTTAANADAPSTAAADPAAKKSQEKSSE